MLKRLKSLLIYLFLITSNSTFSQCNINAIIITPTNSTCSANGSIDVSIPGGVTCNTWNVFLQKPDLTEVGQQFNANGTITPFSGLAPGNYRIRLSDGFTSYYWKTTGLVTDPTQYTPIKLTSTYVVMNIKNTSVSSSCPSIAPNYVDDTQLNLNIQSGGVGPFQYSVTSSLGTLTSASTSIRTYQFTNLPDGETVSYTVTDLGCNTTKTVSYAPLKNTRTNTISDLKPLYQRDCSNSCNEYEVIFKAWYTGSSKETTAGSMNLSVTSGPNAGLNTTLPLITPLHSYEYRYSSPNLSAGDQYTLTYTSVCWGTSTLTETILAPNNTLLTVTPFSSKGVDAFNNCTKMYGVDLNVASGKYDMFCDSISVEIQKETPVGSGVYTQVLKIDSIDISNLWIQASYSKSTISLSSAGNYKVIATDQCHSVTKNFTIVEPTNPFSTGTSVVKYGSILEGTAGIRILPNNQSGSNLPINVSVVRTDGNPAISYYAPGPYGLAGNYTATFPLTYTLNNPLPYGGAIYFDDLPAGSYEITISNLCKDTLRKTIVLTNADLTSYTPQININRGCVLNNIDFDLQPVNSASSYALSGFFNNVSGAPVGNVPSVTYSAGTTYKGTVLNVPSGSYFIKFNTLGSATYKTISAVTGDDSYKREFYVPIDITPYKDITTKVTSSCLNGKGELTVDITGGTPVFPFVYSIYEGTNPVPMSTDTILSQLDLDAIGLNSVNLAVGTYQIKLISGYSASTPNGCYSTTLDALSVTCSAPLPIELTSFDVINNDCFVQINWSTATERDNRQFEIYRSKDGDNWDLVGAIDGAGNSSIKHTYKMIDNEISNGIYYYYLNQIDYNGNNESFTPKSVAVSGCSNHFMIYPNPATDKTTIVITMEQLKGCGNLNLVDISGATVLSQTIDFSQGQQQFDINTATLSSGVYLVRFSTEEENYPVQKLMIVR